MVTFYIIFNVCCYSSEREEMGFDVIMLMYYSND